MCIRDRFITSQGVLNSTKTSVRNELFSQANLVSAIRLPNNLFTDNAGTEVGSDLIVLQKNLSKKEMSQDERLMTVIQTDTKTALTDNAYFIHHPERIVHTMAKLDTDPYGKPAMVYLHEGKAAGIAGDLRRMLEPSAGVGVFVDSMLRQSPNADVMAFEKDLLTGTILRHLYPCLLYTSRCV